MGGKRKEREGEKGESKGARCKEKECRSLFKIHHRATCKGKDGT